MKKLIIIILIGLTVINVIFILNPKNTKGTKIVENIEVTNQIKDNEDIFIKTIEMCNDENAKQWAYQNDGTFLDYCNNFDCWGEDTPSCKVGMDIDSIDKKGVTDIETIIAVVDTRIDIESFCISESLWINTNEVEGDNIDNDNNGFIDDINGYNFIEDNNNISSKNGYHGTFIAGILCGRDEKGNFQNSIGKYNVKLMCLTALDDTLESAEIRAVIDAIKYAEDNGAQVCCLSLGTYIYSEELEQVIADSEMLFVVAAGNDGLDLDHEVKIYPASFNLDNIIVVASMRCDGKLDLTSNYGSETVDIVAPGTDILGTLPDNRYAYFSGSSFAVPFVAGVASKVYITNENNISAREVKKLILRNVSKNNTLEGKVNTIGCINERKVLQALEG